MELIKLIYSGLYIIYLRVYIFWNNDLQSHKHKSRGSCLPFMCRTIFAVQKFPNECPCSGVHLLLHLETDILDRGAFFHFVLGCYYSFGLHSYAAALPHSICLISEAEGGKPGPTQKHLLYLKQCMCSRLNKAFKITVRFRN